MENRSLSMAMVAMVVVVVSALLPCGRSQMSSPDPLCANVNCPAGQECRLYKNCGLKENCPVNAVCVAINMTQPSCRLGKPIVYQPVAGRNPEDLPCYNAAPCPENAYCSAVLADAGSVCCLSATRDPTSMSLPRPGSCPKGPFNPDRIFCVDECKVDGDCFSDSKCCYTGCSKTCTHAQPPDVQTQTVTTPSPTPEVSPFFSNPCRSTMCAAGLVCRVVKPCGPKGTCRLQPVCIAPTKLTREYCHKSGDKALLTYDENRALEYLSCYGGASCPSNAYCSTRLMDVSSACCFAGQNLTKPGMCHPPSPKFDRHFCVDECKSDNDCVWDEKCCNTGCSLQCTSPAPHPPTPPTGAPALPEGGKSRNPCDDLPPNYCGATDTCRVIKPCGVKETCALRAICTAQKFYKQYCTKSELAILTSTPSSTLDHLSCHPGNPCPGGGYCSTRVMDTFSACCLPDKNVTKTGMCAPPSRDFDRNFCVDQCKSDGDCDWNMKCCNTGCSMECSNPAMIPPPVPETPSTPHFTGDICDIQLCDQGHYCRKRGMRCRTPWNCKPEGSCIRCESITGRPSSSYEIVADAFGCDVLKPRAPVDPVLMQLHNHVTTFLKWLYALEWTQ